jgi:hypothetical protein
VSRQNFILILVLRPLYRYRSSVVSGIYRSESWRPGAPSARSPPRDRTFNFPQSIRGAANSTARLLMLPGCAALRCALALRDQETMRPLTSPRDTRGPAMRAREGHKTHTRNKSEARARNKDTGKQGERTPLSAGGRGRSAEMRLAGAALPSALSHVCRAKGEASVLGDRDDQQGNLWSTFGNRAQGHPEHARSVAAGRVGASVQATTGPSGSGHPTFSNESACTLSQNGCR